MGLALVGASVEGRVVEVLWAPTAVGQRGAQTRTLSLFYPHLRLHLWRGTNRFTDNHHKSE